MKKRLVNLLIVLLLGGFLSVSVIDAKAATEKIVGPDGRTYDVPVDTSSGSMPDASRPAPEAFGTSSATYSFPAAAFKSLADGTLNYGSPTSYYRYRTGGDAYVYADFDVPTGANVTFVRLYYYDNDATAAPTLFVCRAWVDDSTGMNPGNDCPYFVTGSVAGTPGYTSMAITTPFTVERNITGSDYAWYIVIQLPTTNANIAFLGVRTLWYRQISPAPAVASFTDVPTSHPFFQYIEALKAASITAGCTSTQFCPDNPVTRSQMAAFLARALGLHWPY